MKHGGMESPEELGVFVLIPTLSLPKWRDPFPRIFHQKSSVYSPESRFRYMWSSTRDFRKNFPSDYLLCPKKQISPRMTQIYKFKMFLLNFFDPCKSVLSVLSAVRFWFLCKAPITPFLRVSKVLLYFTVLLLFAGLGFSSLALSSDSSSEWNSPTSLKSRYTEANRI